MSNVLYVVYSKFLISVCYILLHVGVPRKGWSIIFEITLKKFFLPQESTSYSLERRTIKRKTCLVNLNRSNKTKELLRAHNHRSVSAQILFLIESRTLAYLLVKIETLRVILKLWNGCKLRVVALLSFLTRRRKYYALVISRSHGSVQESKLVLWERPATRKIPRGKAWKRTFFAFAYRASSMWQMATVKYRSSLPSHGNKGSRLANE